MTLEQSMEEADALLRRTQKAAKNSIHYEAYMRLALRPLIAKGLRARETYPEL